jgi:hypothetical protein
VIYDGRIVAQFAGAEATMGELGLYMTGARGAGGEGPGGPEPGPPDSREPAA